MPLTDVQTAFETGLMIGVASTLSIGPNNLMLIREGLRRGYANTVATTVCVNYLALGVGAYGLADAVGAVPPQLRVGLTVLGPVAIAVFAVRALLTALRPARIEPAGTKRRDDRAGSVRRAMLTVWCNPLTYVERLIVPAIMCAGMAADSRLAFIGALLVTGAACCFGYAHGGGLVRVLVRSDGAVRSFDLVSGLILAAVAVLTGGQMLLRAFTPA